MLISQNILNKIVLQFIGFIHMFFIFHVGGSTLIAKERLKLKSADLLERKTINGQPTKLISGNVIFTKGALLCKIMNTFFSERFAILYGDVVAFKEDLMVTCDTIKFSEEDCFQYWEFS